VDFRDAGFEAELGERGAEIRRRLTGGGFDLIFYPVEHPIQLERLPQLRGRLKPAGAIWVLRRKGAGRTVREVDIIDAGKRSGLVDNKIASFSDQLAAMRLVIPLSRR
jgi:hypothetical protein